MALVQNVVERSYEKGSYGTLFACCASFMLISFYIRSDVRTFLRYFIWSALPVIAVQQVVFPRAPGYDGKGKQSKIALSNDRSCCRRLR